MNTGKMNTDRPEINMDKPEYQELAALIEYYHDRGWGWDDSQRIALADMALKGWVPQ